MDKQSTSQTDINQPQPAVENQPPVPPPAKKFNNLVSLLILVILILLSVSGYLGYRLFQQSNQNNQPVPESYQPDIKPTEIPDPTANWKTYSNQKLQLNFKYPPEWTYKELDSNKTSIDFITGIESQSTADNEVVDYKININLDPPENFKIWSNDKLTNKLNNININGKEFERYLVPDMFQSLNYIYKHPSGKIYRLLVYPFEENGVFESVETTVKNMLSTFKFDSSAGIIMNSPTPSIIILDKTYTDKDFGYKISYPNSWVFQRTYGSDISKAGTTDIKSGIDLHYPAIIGQLLSVVVNVLDSQGLTNINDWISKYDLNYPKNAIKDSVSFHGLNAVKYTYSNAPGQDNEAIFFIKGSYAYRIYYYEKGGISENLRNVVESFNP